MNEHSFMSPADLATGLQTAPERADKRELILDAALHLFAERTFAGCAVPLVAQAAGVATGTIYRYFPSKEALLNAVYQRWKGELKRRLVDDVPSTSSTSPTAVREEFHRWWATLASFVDEHPVAFAFLELHHLEPYLDETSRSVAFDVDATALALAERGRREGVLRDDPAPLVVALVFGAFTGVVRARRSYGDLFEDDALAHAESAAWDLIRAH
jgi:AcrR family transcriptional regulator